MPMTLREIFSLRKFSTILGEKSEEYMVSTAIIVEKVKVVMVSRLATKAQEFP